MTDLETACRELVAEFRGGDFDMSNYKYDPYNASDGAMWMRKKCADELETALEEHTPDAADMDPEVKTLVEQMEDAT